MVPSFRKHWARYSPGVVCPGIRHQTGFQSAAATTLLDPGEFWNHSVTADSQREILWNTETTGAQESVWWGAEWLVLNQKKNDGGESTFSDNSELRVTDGSTEGLDAGQYRQLVTDVQFLPKSSRQNMDACILSPFSILLICLLTIRVKLTIIPQLMPKPR